MAGITHATDATTGALLTEVMWDEAHDLSCFAEVALTDGATITPDFSAGFNFAVTLGGNRALANPANAPSGQSGSIAIKQDATGSRTLTYGSSWRFESGAALGGILTTAANAVDVLSYFVRADGTLLCVLAKDFKA